MTINVESFFPSEDIRSGWQDVFEDKDYPFDLCRQAQIQYGVGRSGKDEFLAEWDPFTFDLGGHTFALQFSVADESILFDPKSHTRSKEIYWNESAGNRLRDFVGNPPKKFPLLLTIHADADLDSEDSSADVFFQLRLNGEILDCLYRFDPVTGLDQTGVYDKKAQTFRPDILFDAKNPAELASLQIRITPPFASSIPAEFAQSPLA